MLLEKLIFSYWGQFNIKPNMHRAIDDDLNVTIRTLFLSFYDYLQAVEIVKTKKAHV